MRHEAEVRLRAQSNELKRFHDKVCLRVTERERQNRLNAQRAQKCLPCANNCALYKQPKKREKLLTSVYKQQQLDVTTAASPTR
ncbi:hypothetical protein AM587_10014195 [Phytophthora nicotianae]|uniref:Uncharacterized protein n=1 Tax=Phytophthora nicotianae TaxID=4792 RepID=A0A0W8CNP5_PHYNI|nr:hypothetical protein AM587_10014195 [Phytophthora nicotianae]